MKDVSFGESGDRVKLAVYLMLAAIASITLGDWVGEGATAPQSLAYASLLTLGLLTLGALLAVSNAAIGRPGKSWAYRTVAAAALSGVFASGLFWGQRVGMHAYNESVNRGDEVRHALSDFQVAHGKYPDSLDELGVASLPGERLLRGNILDYRSDGSTYHIQFSDWLVSNEASDKSPFVARK